MRVAVLGTGIMGGAMARQAAAAGHGVRAWSRPLEHARALESHGIGTAESAREAAAGAELVVTMAPDADATESFAAGDDGFLGAAAEAGAVWAQCATVGLDGCERLARLAAEAGVPFVDSPVLGTKEPAERGELVVLASGSGEAIDRCEPFFDAIGRRTLRLGEAGTGTRVKLVTNDWIVGTIAVLGETLALAEALGVDGGVFLQAIEGGAIDMGYAQVKGRMMLADEYPPSFALAHAAKDARLAAEAARRHNLSHSVTRAAAELLTRAAEGKDAGEDMAAVFRTARRQASSGSS